MIGLSLWRQWPIFLAWIISLALSLSGLSLVDIFRYSLSHTLVSQGRQLLGAELVISSRFRFNETQLKQTQLSLPEKTRISQNFEVVGMLRSKDLSRLVTVRFIDENYPLDGVLMVDHSRARSLGVRDLWVPEDLLTLMNLKIGEEVQLGEGQFILAGVITKDSTQTFRFSGMPPRLYAPLTSLEQTRWIQFGSTFTENWAISSPTALTEQQVQDLKTSYPNPEIQFTTPKDLEQGPLRVISRLMDFLGLLALVSMALGWIAVYFLARRWLALERATIGLLMAIGWTRAQLLSLLNRKLILVLSLGVLVAGLSTALLAQYLAQVFKNQLPADFQLSFSYWLLLDLFVAGPGLGWLLLRPEVKKIVNDLPLNLMRGSNQNPSRPTFSESLYVLLAVFVFAALAGTQARSWTITGLFLGALAATVLVLTGMGWLICAFAQSRNQTENWKWRLIFSQWARERSNTILLFAVCSTSLVLTLLLPTIESSILSGLQTSSTGPRPQLFLFDVQDEQRQPLKDFAAAENLTFSDEAPFIRARILEVNGQAFERTEASKYKTREEENADRFRNRGVNLSFRQTLPASQKIVSGKSWEQLSTDFQDAEVSVEVGYADRLGLKIGDQLQFDIQGIELTARIANLREVDWSSFQPNFFIQFPAGLIEEAPKTWVMTMQTGQQSPTEAQLKLANRFPNVTALNVEDTVKSVGAIVQQLASSLRLGSYAATGLGALVFAMILTFQLLSGRLAQQQLTVLGLSLSDQLRLQLLRFALLVSLALVASLALSQTVAWILLRFAMKISFHVDVVSLLGIGATSLILTLLLVTVLTWFVQRTSHPRDLLSLDFPSE